MSFRDFMQVYRRRWELTLCCAGKTARYMNCLRTLPICWVGTNWLMLLLRVVIPFRKRIGFLFMLRIMDRQEPLNITAEPMDCLQWRVSPIVICYGHLI